MVGVLFFSWGMSSDLETQNNEYPYELSYKIDIPMLLTGGLVLGVGQWRLSEMDSWEPNKSVYNLPWDRPFRGDYNVDAEIVSDLLPLFSIAPLFLAYRESTVPWNKSTELLSDGVMLLEVLTFSAGINFIIRSSELWPRPSVYSTKTPQKDLENNSSSGSFYSGHVSDAFAVATFLTTTYSTKYPDHPHTKWLALSTYSLASAISYFRVKSGKHYPTDAFVGAGIGAFIGWIVPQVHMNSRFLLNTGIDRIVVSFIF